MQLVEYIYGMNRSIGDIILSILSHSRFYSSFNTRIMKKNLLLFSLLFVFGWANAQMKVEGKVTDSSGEALIGVNVLEGGTTNGAVTDLNGYYSIEVAGTGSVLIFSYTGMSSQSITVDGNSTVDVVMEEDAKLLDAIVVTALGFKEKKDQMGSTSSSIHADDVVRSGEVALLNSLGAKASNVRINRSNGDPGAGSTIRIRGANTISGNGDPLIIVDGVPLNNSTVYGGGNNITGGRNGGISQQSRINDINPNDIASVQILKGASAAALWGSRAANGVVVITTKDGAAGKPHITYKSTFSFDQVSERIPMQTTWGQGRSGVYSPTRAESWGDYIPERSGAADEFDTSGKHFVADDGTVYYPLTTKNSKETFVESNWNDAFQTGGFWENNLTVSGGNNKSTYFLSLGRLDQNGIIKNSYYDRTNIRFNNKVYLYDWLTMSTKTAYTNSKSNRIQQSSNTAGLMLGLLRTPPDFDNSDYKGTYIDGDGVEYPGRHRSYRKYLGHTVNPTYNNPRWTVEEQVASSNVNRFTVTPEFRITPLSWMQVILRGSADISDDKRVYFFPIGSGGARSVGVLGEDIIGQKELNFDAISKSNFSLSSDINLTTTLGWSINDRKYRRNTGSITGFLVNARKETTSLNTAAENSVFENYKTHRRSNRGYGVLGFDLFKQLYVNLSGAMEASSTIKDQFFYPAADLAWDFSKSVDFKFLSFGKLRASWGKVGVQPRPHAFQTLAEGGFTYSTYSDPLDVSLFGGGFRIDDDQGNSDLQPEIKTEFEVGTDLRFLKDKFSLGFTYYQNHIDGILLAIALSPTSGFDTKYGNFGSMENKGVEIDAVWNVINKQDTKFNVNLNFSKNNNLVTDLEGTESIDLTGNSVSSRAIVGYPLGVLYGTGSKTLENGDLDLDDNGFPQLTSSPVVLGDPNPDWRGGLGINFQWKNFGFNAVLEHSHGGEFSPRSLWVLRRFGTTEETANRFTTTKDLVNYAGDVIPSGTTVRGNVEDFGAGEVLLDESWYRTGIGGGFGDNQAYNFAIKDATFTKLREVTLSYKLGSNVFKSNSVKGITLFVTARNFFNWNKIDGIDPETNQPGVSNGFGIEYFTNPQTRSYLFAVSFEF